MGVVQDVPRSIRARAVLDFTNFEVAGSNDGGGGSTIARQQYEALEAVTVGEVVALTADGRITKASGIAADNKPAFAIVASAADAGELASVFNQYELLVFASLSISPGEYIYLTADGSYGTFEYVESNYFQRLGLVVAANTFIIHVGEYKIME